MSQFTKILQRMSAGLSHQHAADFLSDSDKQQALGNRTESGPARKSVPAALAAVRKPSVRRVALLTDGRGSNGPLDYALETCARLGAAIDLLVPEYLDATALSALEKQIKAARIGYNIRRLGTDEVYSVARYVCSNPSLIFLIALPDDPIARVLVEEYLPRHGSRLPVPLVMIEDKELPRVPEKIRRVG